MFDYIQLKEKSGDLLSISCWAEWNVPRDFLGPLLHIDSLHLYGDDLFTFSSFASFQQIFIMRPQ